LEFNIFSAISWT